MRISETSPATGPRSPRLACLSLTQTSRDADLGSLVLQGIQPGHEFFCLANGEHCLYPYGYYTSDRRSTTSLSGIDSTRRTASAFLNPEPGIPNAYFLAIT